MSDPPETAPPAAPAPPAATVAPRPAPRPPKPARWLGRLSVLLVCVGVGGAIAAGVPAFLRVAAVEAPGATASGPTSAPSTAPAPRSTGYAFDDHPRFAPDDDEPHVTELERLYPDGMWPGQAARGRRDQRESATKAKRGHTLSSLTVREKADAAASTTGQVPAGQTVMVIREAGEWVLVVYQGSNGVTIGWAKRSGIAVP